MRRNTMSVIKAIFFPVTFNSDIILSLRQIFRENVLSVNYKGIYRSNEKNLTMAHNSGEHSLK